MVSEALKTDETEICTSAPKLRRADGEPANWVIADSAVNYPDALATMQERARAIALVGSGSYLGTIAAFSCAPLVSVWWPSIFYLFGSIGFLSG